ncbi:DUF4153 domain-containing protein [Acuticoccus mangrovi]|uniref:DUF4153 domain-containing protein n=1 Tax=Acuticoccus mangrovi TaxID=2796142 RepID=A0A934IMA0_9HYPH|nr:DUF4153 domain-containing protein [Acuticoccus mangrovi]MBJ3775235.1 DUF4153 domain-containing protein [Acuticoccus mangrovi]
MSHAEAHHERIAWSASVLATVRQAPVPTLFAAALTLVLYHLAFAEPRTAFDTVLAYMAAGGFLAAATGQVVAGSVGALVGGAGAVALMAGADVLFVSRALLAFSLAIAAIGVPLIGPPMDRQAAWRSLVRSATAALLALGGAGVVILGVWWVAAGVAALLGLGVGVAAWRIAGPVALGLLAPLIFLTLSERGAESDRVADALGSVAQILTRLVVLPLLAFYTAVLAIYIGRIVVTGTMPSNEVGWIVPLFGVAGAASYLAVAGSAAPGRMGRLFLVSWFPVTIAPLVLYGIALWMRVASAGVTPARYLGVLCGVWLAALALGALPAGRRFDPRLIVVTLALVLALGAVGPWSLRPVVAKSQADRFVERLDVAGVAGLAALEPNERWRVCSSMQAVEEVGGLDRLARRLGVSADALAEACGRRIPGRTMIRFAAKEAAIRTSGPAWVWGPVEIGEGRRMARDPSGITIDVAAGVATVTAGKARHRFDLVAAARELKASRAAETEAEPEVAADASTRESRAQDASAEDDAPAGSDPLVLSDGPVSLWVWSLVALEDPRQAVLRSARVSVVVSERDEPPR